MFGAGLANHGLDIEFFTQAGIKLADADFDLSSQFGKRGDAIQEFAADLLLSCFGQGCSLRDG